MRRLIIGCDPSSKKLAFTVGFGDDDRRMYQGYSFDLPPKDRYTPRRAWEAKRATEELIEVLGESNLDEAKLFIEAPTQGRGGVRASVVQAYINGVVQSEFIQRRVPVHIVPVQTWKKEVVGRGNATKDDVADWARVHDHKTYLTGDQDLMDSLALCVYGEQVESRAHMIGES